MPFLDFHQQRLDTVELNAVMRNQGGIMSAGDRGNERIVRSDRLSLFRRVGVDLPTVFGKFFIREQAFQWGKKRSEQLPVGFHPRVAPCTIEQFGFDFTARRIVGQAMLVQALLDYWCFS